MKRLDDAQAASIDSGVREAHGSSRHNADTDLLDHYIRVGTGELPEGGIKATTQSGRAVNHDDYADAVERAIEVNDARVAAGLRPRTNIYVGFRDPDVVAGQVVAQNGSSVEGMKWFQIQFSQKGPWVTTLFKNSVPDGLQGSDAQQFLR